MIKRAKYEEQHGFIYDYETSNSSFIAMASLLRRKGIKNYKFFLKLYDEDLVGINPLDDSLPPNIKLKIQLEIRRNFWYYIREVFLIPAAGGGIRYELHRGNLSLSWCMLNNIPTYEVLPRQRGKTWGVIAFASWVFSYASDYSTMLFGNKELGASQENLKRLRDARSLLPPYLRNDKNVNDKGVLTDTIANVNRLANSFNNEIKAMSSARNPMAADQLGRGMTTPWIWLDEFAFIQFNRIVYAAMAPAWSKASEVALSKNRPIGKILTTTPGDLNIDMGKFAYDVRNDAARFSEECYDYDEDDIVTWLEKNSRNGYIYIEYSYAQLNCNEKWFEKQAKELLYDWPKIRREILLQWSNAGSNSPFDEDDMRDLRSMMITESDEHSIVINKYYKLNVYRPFMPGHKYIVSIDVAKGRGEKSDRTVVCVTDAVTNKCHAIFKSSIIQYKETYRFLHTLIYKYIPNSVIVIENNIDTLIEYVRESTMKHMLYYEFPKNSAKEQRKDGVIQPQAKNQLVYGLNTNTKTRPMYFDILFEYVRTHKDRICVRELIEEIESLESKTSTRIEAVSGSHDDVVIAYLLGQYVQQFGNNKPRFGLFNVADTEDPDDAIRKEKFKFSSGSYLNAPTKRGAEDSGFFSDMDDEFDTDEVIVKQEAQNTDAFDSGNIFTGNKNELGVATITKNTFAKLNSRNYNSNSYDDNDKPFGADITGFEDITSWF